MGKERIYPHPETNIAPKNRPLEKEMPIRRPTFFGAILVLGSVTKLAIHYTKTWSNVILVVRGDFSGGQMTSLKPGWEQWGPRSFWSNENQTRLVVSFFNPKDPGMS